MAGEVGHKGSKMFLGIGQSNWVAMLTINYRPDWKARKKKKKKKDGWGAKQLGNMERKTCEKS